MNRLLALCAALALTLPLTACNQAAEPAPSKADHDADVKAIQNTEAQWNADWASRDIGKITSHYTDNAILMIAGSEPVSGKDAIIKALTPMANDPATSLKFHADHVDASGDLGYTQGAYTLTLTEPQSKQIVHDHGTYVTVYTRQVDGSWKAVSDAAISSVPPAAPASAPPAKAARKAM